MNPSETPSPARTLASVKKRRGQQSILFLGLALVALMGAFAWVRHLRDLGHRSEAALTQHASPSVRPTPAGAALSGGSGSVTVHLSHDRFVPWPPQPQVIGPPAGAP